MPKPLVLSDVRTRAGAFVADWREAEGYEKGEAQESVRGLLACFGISGRTAAVYEKRARRASTGQHGFIDALTSGTALIEMKSAGKDLETAEAQALDYIESLTEHERPDSGLSLAQPSLPGSAQLVVRSSPACASRTRWCGTTSPCLKSTRNRGSRSSRQARVSSRPVSCTPNAHSQITTTHSP